MEPPEKAVIVPECLEWPKLGGNKKLKKGVRVAQQEGKIGTNYREPARPVRATNVADVHVLAQDMVQDSERRETTIQQIAKKWGVPSDEVEEFLQGLFQLPANYWQQAGRAGRHHRMAVDLTYCRPVSHDRAYFAEDLDTHCSSDLGCVTTLLLKVSDSGASGFFAGSRKNVAQFGPRAARNCWER